MITFGYYMPKGRTTTICSITYQLAYKHIVIHSHTLHIETTEIKMTDSSSSSFSSLIMAPDPS